MIKKQIYDLRERINDYKVLGLHQAFLKRVKNESLPDHADIILFGPSGAGKSSLIRTFYRALHDER